MRILRLVGTLELVSLILMLLNLVTVHHPTVSSVMGPLHGLTFTASVLIAALLSAGRHRVWLLALVPGVGGLLAARALRAAEVPE